jgi:hypothetical protein
MRVHYTMTLPIAFAAWIFASAALGESEDAGPFTPEDGEAETAPQSLDELIAALRSPDSAARVRAVQTLGERGDVAAVPHLITIVRSDPIPEVRGWAVRALNDLGTPEARAAVVTASREDPDERVRTMSGTLVGAPSSQVPSPYGVTPTPMPAISPMTAVPSHVSPVMYRYQRDRGRSLRIAGWVLTGVSYGLALLTGLAMLSTETSEYDDMDYIDWGWKMLLPVVGPAVAATTNNDDFESGASVIFWLWSAVQATGVILLAVGYARRARERRESEEGEEEASSSFGLAFVPGGPGGPAGLTLTGTW